MRAYLPLMRSVEATDIRDTLPLETLRSVLQDHPVQLAILFGSYARGTAHPRSDIDIAIELDTLRPADQDYNDVFFTLSADLSETLGTDDIDLVDIHTLSPTLAETVFDNGICLIGDWAHAAELRYRVVTTESDSDERSPRQRFDTALVKINEHLGGSAVTATDGSKRER
jgi:predicted nucleotidyltransferase